MTHCSYVKLFIIGILLWEIYSLGQAPYFDIDDPVELVTKLLNGYRMKKPALTDDKTYELIQNCWSAIPEDRPNFNDIAEDLNEMLM